jgi:hypothetical protein
LTVFSQVQHRHANINSNRTNGIPWYYFQKGECNKSIPVVEIWAIKLN